MQDQYRFQVQCGGFDPDAIQAALESGVHRVGIVAAGFIEDAYVGIVSVVHRVKGGLQVEVAFTGGVIPGEIQHWFDVAKLARYPIRAHLLGKAEAGKVRIDGIVLAR